MLRSVRLEGNLLPKQLIILAGSRCRSSNAEIRVVKNPNDEPRRKTLFLAFSKFTLPTDFEVIILRISEFRVLNLTPPRPEPVKKLRPPQRPIKHR